MWGVKNDLSHNALSCKRGGMLLQWDNSVFEASKQKEVSSYVKIEEELLPLYRQLRNGKNIEQTRLLCEMVYVVCKTKYLMMLG